jgi:hypothetical protein
MFGTELTEAKLYIVITIVIVMTTTHQISLSSQAREIVERIKETENVSNVNDAIDLALSFWLVYHREKEGHDVDEFYPSDEV